MAHKPKTERKAVPSYRMPRNGQLNQTATKNFLNQSINSNRSNASSLERSAHALNAGGSSGRNSKLS